MNWLALSPLEIAVVWTGLAAAALWLYLHHRRPQRRRVSTLRFWASINPVSQPRRRKLREPWAFLAQILFLLFLVLALANPRLGPAYEGRSDAIVLDASIWSQAHPSGESVWIDRERTEALRLLDSFPITDRILLLRAESGAPPIVPFTTDRGALRRAIQGVQPSSAAADIPRALEVGRAALGSTRRGLLAYVGPGLVDADEARRLDDFRMEVGSASSGIQPQLLMRLVGDPSTVQNRGITRLSLRRDAAQPDRWRLLTHLKNYGTEKADLVLAFSVDGRSIGQRKISLDPASGVNLEDEFTWDQGGKLQAEISPADSLAADDRAIVNIPTFRSVHVAVFSPGDSPLTRDLLGVLSSNPYIQAQTFPAGTQADSTTDVAIHIGESVPARIDSNSIWFLGAPAAAGARPLRVVGWNLQHPVTRWVRTHDVSVRSPVQLKLLPGDTVLASSEGDPPAPLIVAREQNGSRALIVGFNPHDSNLPQEPAFPLLMAGAVEWMTHSVDEVADSFSTGELDLPFPAAKIIAPSGKEVPFARQGSEVRLLATETGMYRIVAPAGGEAGVAVNPPALPTERLQLTSTESAEAEGEARPPAAWDMWRWLAVLAIVALWLEWWLYYAARERQRTAEAQEIPVEAPAPDFDRELEEREESVLGKRNLVGR